MQPDDQKLFEQVAGELGEVLNKHNVQLVVEAVFTDALGNAHVIPAGHCIAGRTRVVKLPAKKETNAKPKSGGTKGK